MGITLWVTVHGGCCSWPQKSLVSAGWAIFLFSCTSKFPFRDSVSGILGSVQSGEVFSGWRALTIERPVMNQCGQGHWKEAEAQVSKANSWQK